MAGLRVGVRGGGCSGFQYQLAFDEQRESDVVFESHGLKLLVDGESLQFVRGSTIDYEESLQGAGFKVEQPQRRGRLRLRLLLPRRRGGAGLGGLSARPLGDGRVGSSREARAYAGAETVAILPQALRRLTPTRLRDDVRLRALAVGLGLIPPRTMHSAEDAGVLLDAARGARRVVEIGVYEGASALALCEALGAGRRAASDRPVRLAPGRAAARLGRERVGHPARGRARRAPPRRRGSARALARGPAPTRWPRAGQGEVDLVFIDGDHSEAGCELDWSCWQRFVAVGGRVVFHDARAGQPGGRGLPGPTAVVTRHFRGAGTPGLGDRRRGRPHGRRRARIALSAAAGLTAGWRLWYGRRDMMSSVAKGAERPGLRQRLELPSGEWAAGVIDVVSA